MKLTDNTNDLRAENDRLRKALTDIRAMTDLDDPASYACDGGIDCVEAVHNVADIALKGGAL